jgi:hypothetical protein
VAACPVRPTAPKLSAPPFHQRRSGTSPPTPAPPTKNRLFPDIPPNPAHSSSICPPTIVVFHGLGILDSSRQWKMVPTIYANER